MPIQRLELGRQIARRALMPRLRGVQLHLNPTRRNGAIAQATNRIEGTIDIVPVREFGWEGDHDIHEHEIPLLGQSVRWVTILGFSSSGQLRFREARTFGSVENTIAAGR